MAIETAPVALPRPADRADSLTVRDDRTGKTYVIPIEDGAIRATELNKIRTAADDPGLLTYDPGFMASCVIAATRSTRSRRSSDS
jgi:citrate synthase